MVMIGLTRHFPAYFGPLIDQSFQDIYNQLAERKHRELFVECLINEQSVGEELKRMFKNTFQNIRKKNLMEQALYYQSDQKPMESLIKQALKKLIVEKDGCLETDSIQEVCEQLISLYECLAIADDADNLQFEQILEQQLTQILYRQGHIEGQNSTRMLAIVHFQMDLINGFMGCRDSSQGSLCAIPILRMINIAKKCCLNSVVSLPKEETDICDLVLRLNPNHLVAKSLLLYLQEDKLTHTDTISTLFHFVTDSQNLEMQMRIMHINKLSDLI